VSVQEAGRIDTTPLEEEERDLRQAIEEFKLNISKAKVDLESAQKSAEAARQEKARAQTRAGQIKGSLDDLRDRLERYLERKQEIQKRIEKCSRVVGDAEKTIRDTEIIIERKKEDVRQKRIVADENTRALLQSHWDGEDLQLAKDETFESLGKKIANYHRKLEEGKQSVGLGQRSRDQALSNLKNAQEDFDQHKQSLDKLRQQLEDLTSDRKKRNKKWRLQREKNALEVAGKFDYYLQKKGCRYVIFECIFITKYLLQNILISLRKVGQLLSITTPNSSDCFVRRIISTKTLSATMLSSFPAESVPLPPCAFY
jgi:chromosome segregation ATPase